MDFFVIFFVFFLSGRGPAAFAGTAASDKSRLHEALACVCEYRITVLSLSGARGVFFKYCIEQRGGGRVRARAEQEQRAFHLLALAGDAPLGLALEKKILRARRFSLSQDE